jgi:hypothetical protein
LDWNGELKMAETNKRPKYTSKGERANTDRSVVKANRRDRSDWDKELAKLDAFRAGKQVKLPATTGDRKHSVELVDAALIWPAARARYSMSSDVKSMTV